MILFVGAGVLLLVMVTGAMLEGRL